MVEQASECDRSVGVAFTHKYAVVLECGTEVAIATAEVYLFDCIVGTRLPRSEAKQEETRCASRARPDLVGTGVSKKRRRPVVV